VNAIAATVSLLVVSNVFMTLAWYWHLKGLKSAPLVVAILVSWGIALLEYCAMVPANRLGSTVLTVPQLKILQECLTLLVFIPVAVFVLGEPVRWNYLAAAVLVVGAVALVFKF